MTLNQLIQRIQNLALSHKQIKTFRFGDPVEWLSGGEVAYPACFVDVNTASLERNNRITKFPVQLWLADQVNVDKDTRTNEVEVFSDLMQIMMDMTALIYDYKFQDDWTIGETSAAQLLKEKFVDWCGAVMITIDISIDNINDNCQVPKN